MRLQVHKNRSIPLRRPFEEVQAIKTFRMISIIIFYCENCKFYGLFLSGCIFSFTFQSHFWIQTIIFLKHMVCLLQIHFGCKNDLLIGFIERETCRIFSTLTFHFVKWWGTLRGPFFDSKNKIFAVVMMKLQNPPERKLGKCQAVNVAFTNTPLKSPQHTLGAFKCPSKKALYMSKTEALLITQKYYWKLRVWSENFLCLKNFSRETLRWITSKNFPFFFLEKATFLYTVSDFN